MGAFLVTANEGKVIIKVRKEKVENLFSLKKTLFL
jgi:hydrogenase maturation factor